jgi:hypothetical protein
MLTGCREYRPRLMELARGMTAPDERRVLLAHVELCADCARALDEQLALSAALHSLAVEELPEMAEIETRVLAEFDRSVGQRRTALWGWVDSRKSSQTGGALWWGRRFRLPLAVGLAAALLLGVVAVERRPQMIRPQVRVTASAVQAPRPESPRTAVPVARVRHRVARRQVSEESAPFVPIPYTVPLAPEERATIVRMAVPVAALIAAGYKVETPDPGGVVDADVLVSQDGRARAIRLNSKEEER